MRKNLKNKDKLKVLFISERINLGGAELFLLELLQSLSDKIIPVFLLPSPGPMVKYLPQENIVFWPAFKFKISPLVRSIPALIELLEVLRGSADLIYVNTAYSNKVGLMLAKILDAKEVVHLHSFVDGTELSRDKYRFRHSDLILCSSNALKDQLEGFGFEKLYCMYPGIVLDRFEFRPKVSDKFNICLIGRISKIKRQDLFVKLAKEFPNFTFHIVGQVETEYAYFSYVEELVRMYGLSNVIFHDFLNDIEDFLPKMDVLVSMSEEESFGRVFLEAMASGTLVLASKTEGAKELIEDFDTGILVENNSIDAWRDAILWVYNNSEKVLEIKNRARLYVEKFDMKNIARDWLKLMYLLVDR